MLLVLGVQWCCRKNSLTRNSGYDRAAERVLDARWEQDYWFDGAEIGTTDLDQFQIFRLLAADAARHAWPAHERAVAEFARATGAEGDSMDSQALCCYLANEGSLSIPWAPTATNGPC